MVDKARPLPQVEVRKEFAIDDLQRRQDVTHFLLFVATSNKYDRLTASEMQALALLVKGDTNYMIAQKLHITIKTVEAHLTRIYKKLDVTSRTQAIIRAQEMHLPLNYIPILLICTTTWIRIKWGKFLHNTYAHTLTYRGTSKTFPFLPGVSAILTAASISSREYLSDAKVVRTPSRMSAMISLNRSFFSVPL